jgi:ATP-binding cassette, subfamily C, bacterial
VLFFTLYKTLFRVTEGRAHVLALLAVVEETRGVGEHYPGTMEITEIGDIALRNVSFGYTATPVLNDVTYAFPRGSMTVITGPSGRGKSTLLDLLLAFQEPQSGRLLVGNTNLFTDLDVWAWRRLIGYVPQEQVLLNDTIFENITMGTPDFTEEQVKRALEMAAARDFVNSLPGGIRYRVGERGSALSGGQRQRIALARAFVKNPKILLLDEPTSALDGETERQIIANVKDLQQKTKLTVIAISHQPAWLSVADQVLAL